MAIVKVDGHFGFYSRNELRRMKASTKLGFLQDVEVQVESSRTLDPIFGVEYFFSAGVINVYRVKEVTWENFKEFLTGK